MKLVMVSVKDRAAEAFMRPWVVQQPAQAIRSFTDEVNRAAHDNPIYQHPEDYDLYTLGTFDEETGQIEPEYPTVLIRAKDVVLNP